MEMPKLRDEPSFGTIVDLLESLTFSPHKWDSSRNKATASPAMDASFVQKFCITIISNDLQWLPPEERDLVYDLASKRIAERCGRSAMPTMERTWSIPRTNGRSISLRLREPALTGDNLGHKTWGTSYVLAKRLEVIGQKHFIPLLEQDQLKSKESKSEAHVLERSGTGLVGLAMAHIFEIAVLLTDLAEVTDNLNFNIRHNSSTQDSVSATELDWNHPEKTFLQGTKFSIIIAADPLYDDEHPKILANTINLYADDLNCRVLTAVPLRDVTTERLSEELNDWLNRYGFEIQERGYEICVDDWEESENDDGVRMIWTVWKKRS